MAPRASLALAAVACVTLACSPGNSAHPPGEPTAVAIFTTDTDASGDASTGDTSATDASIDAAPAQDAALGYPLNGPIPACSWPTALDPPETGPTWIVARFWVWFGGNNGVGFCLTDDPTTCPGPIETAEPGTNGYDRCSLSQYVVGWGGGEQPYVLPPLPATCWIDPILNTIGGQYACCPCE